MNTTDTRAVIATNAISGALATLSVHGEGLPTSMPIFEADTLLRGISLAGPDVGSRVEEFRARLRPILEVARTKLVAREYDATLSITPVSGRDRDFPVQLIIRPGLGAELRDEHGDTIATTN